MVARERRNFDDPKREFIPYPCHGLIKDKKTFIIPSTLKQWLTEGNFNAGKILSEWKEEKSLDYDVVNKRFGRTIRDHRNKTKKLIQLFFVPDEEDDPPKY